MNRCRAFRLVRFLCTAAQTDRIPNTHIDSLLPRQTEDITPAMTPKAAMEGGACLNHCCDKNWEKQLKEINLCTHPQRLQAKDLWNYFSGWEKVEHNRTRWHWSLPTSHQPGRSLGHNTLQSYNPRWPVSFRQTPPPTIAFRLHLHQKINPVTWSAVMIQSPLQDWVHQMRMPSTQCEPFEGQYQNLTVRLDAVPGLLLVSSNFSLCV